MARILHIPKVQLTITLLLIFITSLLHAQSLTPLIALIAILFATIGSDLVFAKIRRLPLFLPSAAVVSALIISLLTSPNLPFYEPMLIGVIAMLFKNFLRVSSRHVFNPVAIGLLIGAFLFGHNISWWGVSFQQFSINNFQLTIYFLILLSPALVSIYRMRRHKIILAFLLSYALLNAILHSTFNILPSITDPTILFFSLVMLPEPMTSPNRPNRQILFGIFAAVISLTVSLPIVSSISSILSYNDPFIASLIIANAVFFKLR